MAYIGNSPGVASQRIVSKFTATASQTTFTPTSGYTVGYLDVYLNGVKLINGEDYTASNGSTFVLASGAASGDIVESVAYLPRGLSDGYTKAEADARYMDINSVPTPAAVSDAANTSTGYFALPTGTTAQRPGSAAAGYTRMNTTTGSVEFYDGTNWIATNLIPTINSITGTIYSGLASTLTLSLTNATDTIDVKYYEGGTLLATDIGVTVTSGSATSTVPSAVYGQTAGDTISIQIFNQDDTPSSNSINKTVQGLPTGGTVTTSGVYRYHTFTSSSSLTVPSGFSAAAEFLIVAGGGGGGSRHGGGGGAGGAIDSTTSISANTYTITVGSGGSGAPSGGDTYGVQGSSSSAFGFTAIGGGFGTSLDGTVGSGGSGGGSRGNSSAAVGGSGTSGQGNRGGGDTGGNGGGGGGGKSAVGQDGSSGKGGDGGAGFNWKSLGTYYAGGGGGGVTVGGATTTGRGAGGIGGGGRGNFSGDDALAGTANTGGGGGGGGHDTGTTNYTGKNGGSGIVIVRYQL
jgi:hypothetical protein